MLECNNVKYDVVEVDPLFKTEIKSSGYGKVPQLRLGDDGPLLVDSDHIVEHLAPLFLGPYEGSADVGFACSSMLMIRKGRSGTIGPITFWPGT
jgi:glutathione S-transferase